MNVDLMVLGLIFNFLGTFILILVTLFGGWYNKVYNTDWKKRYYWQGLRINFKTFPPKLNRRLKEGFIPPNHMWNVIGFLLIAIGFLLQLIEILN